MAQLRFLILVLSISFLGIENIYAEETDQYTLPRYELRDMGSVASQNLYAVIAKVIKQTNVKIARLESQAEKGHDIAHKLASYQQGEYLADLIFNHSGPGKPRWLQGIYPGEAHHVWQYKEIFPWNSVYWLVFSQSPLSFIGLSPTIRMFDHYFGMDKLGHFFSQGHNYYKMYHFFLKIGQTPEQAQKNLILYAQIVEQSYLGTLINGVYSNADLWANYAGWKFYTNLTESIKVGDQTLPPILVLKDNQWQFSDHIHQGTLLKPYISDNWNEAWNPSRFAFMRKRMREQIKARCSAWISQNHLTKELLEEKFNDTHSWHGENYGYWLPVGDAVSLEVCFKNQG